MINKFCTYIIHNIINNKVYVGKANSPQKRWNKHIKIAAGKRSREKFVIHKAISKYGVKNFTFSILQYYNDEYTALMAETYWIKHFQSNIKEFGYNLTEGGEGCSGRIISEETRQKMREKAIGRKHTEETKEKLKIINLGKMPTNLEQLKTINVGKTLSLEHKQNISKSRTGIIFTDEHKNNISKSHIGLLVGDKNPFFGKTHTEKVKEMSRGENNKQAKLTSDNVIIIRTKYASGNYSQQKLADEFHVSRKAINYIVNGKTWAHLLKE